MSKPKWMSRDIFLTNTVSHKKELLTPIEEGRIKLYSCGPTVYGFIHIGNLRAALTPDLLYRYLLFMGFEVTYVRNYTDVDDKIIDRANKEGVSVDIITKKYISEVEKDYAVAGLKQPTHKTLVTEHMPEIISMIEKIIENGKAYVVDGEVFFAIDQFPEYGRLSQKPLDDLIAGVRVEVNSKKRNPLDFSLWKPAKPGEPFWESPWGKGRPGWHIECSAMSYKWLGQEFDIHHGGIDLVFPHHENEIAQSEAACGHRPSVRYWVHNAFVNLASGKMSKSLGNIISARDFLTRFSGEFARYCFLSSHYRHTIEFGDELLEQAISSLTRIYEAKSAALFLIKKGHETGMPVPDLRAENIWGQFLAECEKSREEIEAAYANDLNTAEALAALFKLIREFNRVCKEPLTTASSGCILGAGELVKIIEHEIGDVIGIGKLQPEKAFEDLERIKRERGVQGVGKESGGIQLDRTQIELLIAERTEAKNVKDFKKADEIRKQLETAGIIIKDSPLGTTWTYR